MHFFTGIVAVLSALMATSVDAQFPIDTAIANRCKQVYGEKFSKIMASNRFGGTLVLAPSRQICKLTCTVQYPVLPITIKVFEQINAPDSLPCSTSMNPIEWINGAKHCVNGECVAVNASD